ncbi:MAG TPA: hemolysin family protein [Sandaracinaceae bacterium LLY-WYZ-13_1]|nr:hemolysin family protein [Sandaracinaceae bacterium LLY-WYZ-13_1]
MPESVEGPGIELAAILLTIAAGAALSALEGALGVFGEVRLLDAKEQGGAAGRTAERVLREGTRLQTRLLTGRVVAIVVAVGLTVHVTNDLGPWWVTALGLAGVALLYATLAVGLGTVARTRSVGWALPMARWLRPIELLVWPLSVPLAGLVRFLDRRFPPPEEPPSDDHAVREVEHMIEQREESGSISEDFAELLLSVLEFKDTVAREVMVPRTQMKAIELQTSIDDVLEMIVREGHSRYPVYRDRVDQIEGVLYAKDLFRILRNGEREKHHSLHRIIRRPVFFVAETHKIGQLLREMQARRFHLAVVVDEFGGTSGIVTLEDILEEIVGEIEDEHDTDEPMIQEIARGRWWVDARVSVYDLAEELDEDIGAEEGDFDSLGGMVVELAGRVPQIGESVLAHGFEFIVREADERHVTRVEVLRRPDSEGGDDVHVAAE